MLEGFIELPTLQCSLNKIVPGSKICILTDYPSENDCKERRAFSDSSGTILSMCLGSAHITLAECSIVFLIEEACGRTGASKFYSPKMGLTTSGAANRQAIKDVLEELKPNVVVALGDIALASVTSHRSSLKYRGSILESDLIHGLKVIPSVHPRDCIRMYIWRYFLQADMRKVGQEQYSPEINVPNRTLIINPSYLDIINYLNEIKETKPTIAVDIECSKKRKRAGMSCISIATNPLVSMSIPLDERWTLEEEAAILVALSEVLEDTEIAKIFQNGFDFDIVYILAMYKMWVRGYIHDTMVKQHLNYPDFPKSLAFLTSLYTNEPYYKDDGKGVEVSGNRDGFYIYNAKDSAVDYEINDAVTKELTQYQNNHIYEFIRQLAEPLLYFQLRGIRIDEDKLCEYRKEVSKQIEETQRKLDALIGNRMPLATKAQQKNYYYERLNPSSPDQCKTFFYTVMGYAPQMSRTKDPKTGEFKKVLSAGNKPLNKLIKIYKSEEAKLVKQIRALRKLCGTYLEVRYDEDKRLRCCFKAHRTNTLRLASSETIFDTGTNLQNLPKTFKEFLIPDEGHIFFELDKAQAEWVASAYIFGDAAMIRAVEERADIHVRTSHMMFGAPEDLIAFEGELLGSSTDEEEIYAKRTTECPDVFRFNPLPNMSMRQSGKKCNHSFNYGLSAKGFSIQYEMEERFSKRCYNLYHAGYPGIHFGHERIRRQLAANRTLVNLFGWKRRFMGRIDENLYKAAYAFKPQSTVGMLLNQGIIDTYYQQYWEPEKLEKHNGILLPANYSRELSLDSRRYDANYLRKVDMLNQVHDSLFGQYPTNDIEGFARSLLAMRHNLDVKLTADGREFIIRTDCKIGFNAKKMITVDIENGLEKCIESIKAAIEKIQPLKTTPTTIEEVIAEIEEEEDDPTINVDPEMPE